MRTIIRFEDHGQDFCEWDIQNGIVTDSRPFQSTLWNGRIVMNEAELTPGGFVKLNGGLEIKYRLVSVKRDQLVQSEGIKLERLCKSAHDMICTSVDDVKSGLSFRHDQSVLQEVLAYLADHKEQKTKFKIVRAYLLKITKS